jgi:hypothetical protein
MSNEKTAVSVTPAVELPDASYHETAQAFVEHLRSMREKIPHFTVPTLKGGRKTLATVASLPPEFLEVTTVARTNNPALVRGEATTPAESRNLLTYADAYGPVADELEAMAQFVRFSIAAAKSKAGYEALNTYAIAQRLVRRPEHGNLVPYVADMRRAFGNRGKRPKTAAKARKQQQAAATPPTSEEK